MYSQAVRCGVLGIALALPHRPRLSGFLRNRVPVKLFGTKGNYSVTPYGVRSNIAAYRMLNFPPL
jgi:hypothetical protein